MLLCIWAGNFKYKFDDDDYFAQVEEEEQLKAELRKIEARKKEREKKTADLQKLIARTDIPNSAQVCNISDLKKIS